MKFISHLLCKATRHNLPIKKMESRRLKKNTLTCMITLTVTLALVCALYIMYLIYVIKYQTGLDIIFGISVCTLFLFLLVITYLREIWKKYRKACAHIPITLPDIPDRDAYSVTYHNMSNTSDSTVHIEDETTGFLSSYHNEETESKESKACTPLKLLYEKTKIPKVEKFTSAVTIHSLGEDISESSVPYQGYSDDVKINSCGEDISDGSSPDYGYGDNYFLRKWIPANSGFLCSSLEDISGNQSLHVGLSEYGTENVEKYHNDGYTANEGSWTLGGKKTNETLYFKKTSFEDILDTLDEYKTNDASICTFSLDELPPIWCVIELDELGENEVIDSGFCENTDDISNPSQNEDFHSRFTAIPIDKELVCIIYYDEIAHSPSHELELYEPSMTSDGFVCSRDKIQRKDTVFFCTNGENCKKGINTCTYMFTFANIGGIYQNASSSPQVVALLPTGAITIEYKNTECTFTQNHDQHGCGPILSFAPHGLRFQKSVLFKIKLCEGPLIKKPHHKLALFYRKGLSEDEGWINLDSSENTDPDAAKWMIRDDGYLYLFLKHFSEHKLCWVSQEDLMVDIDLILNFTETVQFVTCQTTTVLQCVETKSSPSVAQVSLN